MVACWIAGKARSPAAVNNATAANAGRVTASGYAAKPRPRTVYPTNCIRRAPNRSTAAPANGSNAMPASPATVSTAPMAVSGRPVTL